jgi:hypothetical protein
MGGVVIFGIRAQREMPPDLEPTPPQHLHFAVQETALWPALCFTIVGFSVYIRKTKDRALD